MFSNCIALCSGFFCGGYIIVCSIIWKPQITLKAISKVIKSNLDIYYLLGLISQKWGMLWNIPMLVWNTYKIQTTFHQYQKLYSTLPWHGAHNCKISRKNFNAFSSYIAKTDWRTAFQYLPSRAFGAAGDKKHPTLKYLWRGPLDPIEKNNGFPSHTHGGTLVKFQRDWARQVCILKMLETA